MPQRVKPILIYNDAGADAFCTHCLLRACRAAHGAAELVDAADLLAGKWQQGCAALAFPGGADRPYAEKLDGRGNALIRGYVEGGGRFLGVCAGAYYACRRIDFTGGDFAVKADRELGFFPGTAVGSLPELAAPYRVQDLRCSGVAELETSAGPVATLYWGGCRFEPDADAPPLEILARYAALPPEGNVAAVRMKVGAGSAVLVGVHAEVGGAEFRDHCEEYPRSPEQEPRLDEQVRLLTASDPRRRNFFASLLGALGAGRA